MINNCIIEICCGSIDDVKTASRYPIDRIELNAALELGGLTPSLSTLKRCKQITDLPICTMVRSRGGDFCYSEELIEGMYRDAVDLLENGADGIVFGFLNEDHTINKELTARFCELAHSYHKEAVFHKAFDALDDLDKGIEELIEIGIDRILTGGKSVYPDIVSGCKRLRRLDEKHHNEIQLLPGGGVRIHNIQDVLRVSGLHQIHMTSKKEYPGGYVGIDEEQLKELLNKIEQF